MIILLMKTTSLITKKKDGSSKDDNYDMTIIGTVVIRIKIIMMK